MTDATDPRVRLGQRLANAKLPIGARFVAQMLHTYADWHTGASARPGLPTIAEETGIDIRNVRRHVRLLEQKQIIIAVQRPGNSTWYAILRDDVPSTNSTDQDTEQQPDDTTDPGRQDPGPHPVDNPVDTIHTPGATYPGQLSTPRAADAPPGATYPGYLPPPHPGRLDPPHPGRLTPPDLIDLNDHAVRARDDGPELTGEAITAFGRLLPERAFAQLDRGAVHRATAALAAAGWTRTALATALDARRTSLAQARGAGLAMTLLRDLARSGPPAGRPPPSTAAAVRRCAHGKPLAALDGSGCEQCAAAAQGIAS